MEILWLNDSLVIRAKSREERSALSVVHDALRTEPEPDANGESEGSNRVEFVN
jgi:hypothetical protein